MIKITFSFNVTLIFTLYNEPIKQKRKGAKHHEKEHSLYKPDAGPRPRSRSGEGGSLYELEFTTEEMHYCCYIDAASGEALGLDYFPVPVESYPSYFEERRCERQSVSA